MSNAEPRPLVLMPTNIPHVVRIDLNNDGMAHECAIVKKDKFGNIIYLKISELDSIDRERIGKVLQSRFADQLPLWDLLSQTTLKNGLNALEYFHQLVKGINVDGKSFIPRIGVTGYSVNHQMAAHQANEQAKEAHKAKKSS